MHNGFVNRRFGIRLPTVASSCPDKSCDKIDPLKNVPNEAQTDVGEITQNEGDSVGRYVGRPRVVFTYFLQAFWGGPIKIGATAFPIQRHGAVQTGYPYELKIVGLIQGDRERELHERWGDHRLNGEWFEPVPVVSAGIDDVLREHRGDPFHSDATLCATLKCKGWHPKVKPLWGDPCRNPPQFAVVHRDILRRRPLAPAAGTEGTVRQ